MDLNHLWREARTALELALVALAPSQLVDRLASTAGRLEALTELPADSAPVVATLPRALARAKSTLDEWRAWQEQHREKRIPRS
jgi:beta-lactamase class A